jgi:hypothetical protein
LLSLRRTRDRLGMLRIGGIGKRERCRAGLGRERTVQIPGGPQRQTPSGTRLLCCPGCCWLLVGGENRTHHLQARRQRPAARGSELRRERPNWGQTRPTICSECDRKRAFYKGPWPTRQDQGLHPDCGRKWQEVAGSGRSCLLPCFPSRLFT